MRRAPVAVGVAVGLPASALYLALDWVRYSTGRAGNYDLGIFAQSAQHWAADELPGSSIRSAPSLFADHFSPITVLFGAGWASWPDPRALLVVQSLALGLAAGLIAALAAARLGTAAGAALGLGEALAKGMVSAASFDVHETALGAPLTAGLAWGLLERRPRLVAGCAAGLLLVKEDLGLTVVAAAGVWWLLNRRRGTAPAPAGLGLNVVAAAGVWWLPTGQRGRALALAGLGVAGFAVANAVIVLASPDRSNPYLQFLFGASGNPQGLAGAEVVGGSRWAPTLLFVLTAGVVGLRSPIALLALPTLAWRAASSNVSYWQTYFHYDVLLVPVAAIALVDAAQGLASLPAARRRVLAAVSVVALSGSAWQGAVKVDSWRPTDPARYRLAAPQRAAQELVAALPAGAAVVVQQDLGPAVVAHVDVRMLATTVPARGRWVLLRPSGDGLGAPEAEKRRWLAVQRTRPGVTVTSRGDVVLVALPGDEVVAL